MKRGIISGLDAQTDQASGSGFSGVPVGTVQADTLTPNGPITGRRISGIGTPNVTRNFTPYGTINQDVVSAGAARIAASTRRSLSPTAQELQQRLYELTPDTINRASERHRLRCMTDFERNQEIENAEIAQRIQQSLGLAEPEEKGKKTGARVNIADGTGPTLDLGPQNSPAYSPQAKAYQAKAIREWTEEYGAKLAAQDKSAWQTEEDLNDFVNSLEATKKYGNIIAGTIYNMVHKYLPVELKQKFEVTRMNQDSFTQWMGDMAVDFDQNGIRDTAAEIFHAAKRGDVGAARLVSDWRNTSNAPVYVRGPNGTPIQDPVKAARIEADATVDVHSRINREADERKTAAREKQTTAMQKAWNESPALQKRYPDGVDPFTNNWIQPDKSAIRTPEQDSTDLANIEQQITELEARLRIADMKPDSPEFQALIKQADPKDAAQYRAWQAAGPMSRELARTRMQMLQIQAKAIMDRNAPKPAAPTGDFEVVPGTPGQPEIPSAPRTPVATFKAQSDYENADHSALNDGDIVSVGGNLYIHKETTPKEDYLPKPVEERLRVESMNEAKENYSGSARRVAVEMLGWSLGLEQPVGMGGVTTVTEQEVRKTLESKYAMTEDEIDKTIRNAEQRYVEEKARGILYKKRKKELESRKSKTELLARRRELLGE